MPKTLFDKIWEAHEVAPGLLDAPANVLRISLHPDGMAPRIANLAEWSGHLLSRLRREAALTTPLTTVPLKDSRVATSGSPRRRLSYNSAASQRVARPRAASRRLSRLRQSQGVFGSDRRVAKYSQER